MVCSCLITKEAAESRPSPRRCKRLLTMTSRVQHGANAQEQSSCRRNLRRGYGVILSMLTRSQDGRTGSLRSVAGWLSKAGWRKGRLSPYGPKRRFKQPCARREYHAVHPCISRLRKRFPYTDVRIVRSRNSKTFWEVGFRETAGIEGRIYNVGATRAARWYPGRPPSGIVPENR